MTSVLDSDPDVDPARDPDFQATVADVLVVTRALPQFVWHRQVRVPVF